VDCERSHNKQDSITKERRNQEAKQRDLPSQGYITRKRLVMLSWGRRGYHVADLLLRGVEGRVTGGGVMWGGGGLSM